MVVGVFFMIRQTFFTKFFVFKEKSLFLHSQNKKQCQKEHFNLRTGKEEINMAFAKGWLLLMAVKYSKEEGQKEEVD